MYLPRIRMVALSAVVTCVTTLIASSLAAAEAEPRVTPSSVISTIAGTGEAGYSGDGGPATEATFVQPRDTAVGPDGSIYVTDTRNHVVRRIDPDGIVSTFAGTGEAGFGGDGGPATEAQLTWPHDVTVDSAGNVYITDSNNHRIRLVDTNGVITTIAGTDVRGYNGDGIPAVEAQLRNPKSISLYAGDIYFADSLNHRIRMIDDVTGLITTIAGSGTAGYSGDGGPATEAMLDTPQRIDLDSHGNVYIADTGNNRIRRVNAETGIIETIVGTGIPGYSGDDGLAVDAAVDSPRGLALADNQNLYVADSGNHRIRRINLLNGKVYTVVGTGIAGYSGDHGKAGEGQLQGPRGLTVTPDHALIIADTMNNVVRLVRPCEDFWCGDPPGPTDLGD
jgi:sugar lactone lactonase YvrE